MSRQKNECINKEEGSASAEEDLMNVFEERKFYPNEDIPIKEHYAGTFDSVFLAFLPFFRISEARLSKSSFQRAHQITGPQFKSANPDLNLPENISADIYTNDNPDYPTNDEILRYGTPVRWSEVKDYCNFDSLAELNKALKTAIGSYRAVFSRRDLANRLLQCAERERIFLPEEGTFDVLSKLSILNTFRRLGKGFIVVEDEFLEKKTRLIFGSYRTKSSVTKSTTRIITSTISMRRFFSLSIGTTSSFLSPPRRQL